MQNKILLLVLLFGCSSGPKDPLKNTKKLIKEGHSSLYENGAFAIPSTKIKLIPPGPDAINLTKEMTGLKAKESFVKYLKEIKESSVVIYEGTKKSYTFAQEVDSAVSESMDEIVPKLRDNSIIIMKSSFANSQGISGKTIDFSQKTFKRTKALGKRINKSLNATKFKQSDFNASENFILGYVSLPNKLERRKNNMASSISLKKFVEDFKKSEEFRQKTSSATTYLINSAFENYGTDVEDSFANARTELRSEDEFGYTFAALRSLRWVLDGVLWQGVVKPLGKLTAGAFGYTLVNGVAYPIYLVSRNGFTTAQIAVEVSGQLGMGVIELSAPTVEYALSALLYSGEFLTKQAVRKTSQATGFVVGKSLEYIGAPLSAAAITSAGTVTGVAVGIGGSLLAGSTRAAAEVMNVSSDIVAKTAATTALTGGVVAYTIKGTAEVAYEITKASVVPPGLVLGSGLVLSYGTLAQLGAQSVLAVSDAAYLVLSLEGANWVVYAVSGKEAQADLPEGTIVDLEKIQTSGEEIQKVPVDSESMKRVIESL